MSPKENHLANEIFLEAIELAAEKRDEFLIHRCAGLPRDVRDYVEKLIAADKEATQANFSKLNAPIAGLVEETARYGMPIEVGMRVGPYRLLQKLGEGGMGVVFMAEQKEPVRRHVAVKVIQPGMNSTEVIARFEAERQALAMMDHPNIAKVLDCGTTNSGLPYFVMELVKGIRITEYCDQNCLPIPERLRLFLRVCHATQHAHQKGVIHRDIKPSNVLVAEYDSVPVPKIIDFGLAKALHHALTDRTLFTRFGQILGTYEYMSPEQAKLNQLDIDTRSDVYSLGVLLYELLTGFTPFDRASLREAAFDEMLRMIREEEPPKPSSKLTISRTASEMASKRGNQQLQQVTSLIRGDLDAVVMKALEKERNHRYESCGALADDIEHFLNDTPVAAAKKSIVRESRRFIRRNRTSLLIAMVGVAILTGGLVLGIQNKLRSDKLSYQENMNQVLSLITDSLLERNEKPALSALLAKEAFDKTREDFPAARPFAHATMLESMIRIPGLPLVDPQGGLVDGIQIDPQGKWAMTFVKDAGTKVGDVLLWNLRSFDANAPPHRIRDVKDWNRDANATKVFVCTDNDKIQAWDVGSDVPELSQTLDGFVDVSGFDVHVPSERVVVAQGDGTLHIASLNPTVQRRSLRYPGGPDEKYRVKLTNDGEWIFGWRWSDSISELHLWRFEHDSELNRPAFIRHPGTIRRFLDDATGRFLFTGGRSGDGMVRAWDLSMSDPGSRNAHSWRVPGSMHATAIAVSDDTKWLAVGGDYLSVFEINASDTTNVSQELAGHVGFTKTIDFSADGRLLVSGGNDATVRVWDLDCPDPSSSHLILRGHEQGIVDVRVTDDGSRAISRDESGVARLWNLGSEDPTTSDFVLRLSKTPGQQPWPKLAIGPKSRWCATGAADGTLRLWDLQHPRPSTTRIEYVGHSESIQSIAFSPNANWLLSASDDVAILWDVSSVKQPVATYLPHALTEDGRPFATNSVAFSPDGRWAVTACSDGIARLWPLNSKNISDSAIQLQCNTSTKWELAISPDSRWLATWCRSLVMVWDLQAEDPSENGCVTLDLDGQRGSICDIEFIENGRRLLTTGAERDRILLWDCDAFAEKKKRYSVISGEVRYNVWRAQQSPDGGWLALSCWPGEVFLFDHRNEFVPNSNVELVPAYRIDLGISSFAYSADSRWLAGGGNNGDVLLWDLHATDVHGGKRVLRCHRGCVREVRFSTDGRWLVSASEDGTVALWPMEVEHAFQLLNRAAGRKLSSEELSTYGLTP